MFKEFLEILDHKCLNELEYFQDINPTAENIAKFIYQEFRKVIQPLNIKKVRVWESDMASAIYYEDSTDT